MPEVVLSSPRSAATFLFAGQACARTGNGFPVPPQRRTAIVSHAARWQRTSTTWGRRLNPRRSSRPRRRCAFHWRRARPPSGRGL